MQIVGCTHVCALELISRADNLSKYGAVKVVFRVP